MAGEIWSLSNVLLVKKEFHFHYFMDFLWHAVMVAKWDQEIVEKVIMISWKLWTNRK